MWTLLLDIPIPLNPEIPHSKFAPPVLREKNYSKEFEDRVLKNFRAVNRRSEVSTNDRKERTHIH